MDNRNFDVMAGIGAKSREDMSVISLLKRDFEGENLYPDIKLLDLERVLKIGRDNSIGPKLYAVLKKWHGIPEKFMGGLRRDYLSTAAKNTLIYSELKRVVEGFKDKGIDVIVMKGAV